MRLIGSRSARRFAAAAVVAALAAATAGCQTTQSTPTAAALPIMAVADRSDADWRQDLAVYGQQYRANPGNVDAALHYAQALRATGQRAQAVAVLERVSLANPRDKTVLGAYGRALAEAGNFNQALEVLGRAHSPDQPDWHVLSAQGAVLDQMGRHAEAQRYYVTALKIVPEEPSVLSNLGLSYALAKDLPNAETTLRRAAARRPANPRVRQNLALVVGLQGPSRKRRRSRVPSCRRKRRPPMSPICGKCSRIAAARRPRTTARIRRPAPPDASGRLHPRPPGARTQTAAAYCSSITRIAAGPRITTNSTGRKNRIIGTVSFGGRPAAFFSASDIRMSRFSCASTRIVVPSGVP
jgi:Flp pilus assembly protein TadD